MTMEMMNDQPPPIPQVNQPAIWDLVLEDMQTRDNVGRKRYGTPLQVNNGRDNLRDLYEELLDACCYIRAEIYRRDGK